VRARSPLALLGYALAAVLAVATATRLILLVMHLAETSDPPLAVLAALAAGLGRDLLVALWLCLPLALVLLLLPARWLASGAMRRALAAAGLLAAFVLLFVAVAEVLFFAEFDGRFNFVAVDYLVYPTEVSTNLRESYPIPAILLGLAGLALATWPLLRKALGGLRGAFSLRGRALAAGGYGAAMALLLLVRPSHAVSADRPLNEIAENGYATFWGALLGVDAPYDGLYAQAPDAQVLGRLERLLREPATARSTFASGARRRVHPLRPTRPLNVVVVLEESFGSDFVGALHDGNGVTPHFDTLAGRGTLLTRAYSTGNRTIRALEAVTASVPPLPGASIVRRPGSRDLRTLPQVLREHGYATTFIYGGRSLFDGMGAYMRANGVDRVIEEGDFPDTLFRTAWGVADEYIFDRTLAELDSLDAAGRPSFTLVLTVSNHRPYTYPAGRIPQDPARKRRSHAVHYADWALGRFMDQARAHRFYGHTLVVLMGDHGARVYGAARIPLHSYEVPILFVGPGAVPAGARVGTLASSLDVPPTVLGVLGLDYESSFFGRDVLHLPPDAGRAPLIHNSDLALLEGDQLAVLGLHRTARVFRVADDSLYPLAGPRADTDPVADAVAYFDGADLLYRSGALRATGTGVATQ
jgi:phosphoglycerol transferase MdoB-like AlkP superfamily enzyme